MFQRSMKNGIWILWRETKYYHKILRCIRGHHSEQLGGVIKLTLQQTVAKDLNY